MTWMERVQSLVEGLEADVNRLIWDEVDTTHKLRNASSPTVLALSASLSG